MTAAFQLAQALKRLERQSVDSPQPVQFTPSETTALHDGLTAIGIVDAGAPEAEADT